MAKKGTFGGNRFGGSEYGTTGVKRGFGRSSFGRSGRGGVRGIDQDLMEYFKNQEGEKLKRSGRPTTPTDVNAPGKSGVNRSPAFDYQPVRTIANQSRVMGIGTTASPTKSKAPTAPQAPAQAAPKVAPKTTTPATPSTPAKKATVAPKKPVVNKKRGY